MKKAVQLYSIRKQAAENLETALQVISEIGYSGVEFAVVSVNEDEQKIKNMLDKYNLELMGTHIKSVELFEQTDRAIEFYTALGCKRLIIPSYDVSTMENIDELVGKIKAITPKLQKAGMKLYYHNHDKELATIDGVAILDILAEKLTSDELWLELDVFWLMTGGVDPVVYMDRYADRVDTFHAKDGADRKGSALGCGAVDMPAVFQKASDIGMEWAVVESEASGELQEQIDSIKTDYVALEKLLEGTRI